MHCDIVTAPLLQIQFLLHNRHRHTGSKEHQTNTQNTINAGSYLLKPSKPRNQEVITNVASIELYNTFVKTVIPSPHPLRVKAARLEVRGEPGWGGGVWWGVIMGTFPGKR